MPTVNPNVLKSLCTRYPGNKGHLERRPGRSAGDWQDPPRPIYFLIYCTRSQRLPNMNNISGPLVISISHHMLSLLLLRVSLATDHRSLINSDLRAHASVPTIPGLTHIPCVPVGDEYKAFWAAGWHTSAITLRPCLRWLPRCATQRIP